MNTKRIALSLFLVAQTAIFHASAPKVAATAIKKGSKLVTAAKVTAGLVTSGIIVEGVQCLHQAQGDVTKAKEFFVADALALAYNADKFQRDTTKQVQDFINEKFGKPASKE